ncbi:hypothetical protein BJV74DRAFT_539204 [Russula compacta]|nr:hypothetical protein BJV74DRAFT_539204 [Russula compacta]
MTCVSSILEGRPYPALGTRQSVLTRSVRTSPLSSSSFISHTPTPSLLSNREWHGYTHGCLNPDPNPPLHSSTCMGSLRVTQGIPLATSNQAGTCPRIPACSHIHIPARAPTPTPACVRPPAHACLARPCFTRYSRSTDGQPHDPYLIYLFLYFRAPLLLTKWNVSSIKRPQKGPIKSTTCQRSPVPACLHLPARTCTCLPAPARLPGYLKGTRVR